MKKLTFELEFITPAFLGGADPLKPELRPASFVGLLRFWWRALKSECNIEKLKEEETKIFGGNGKYASKVAIRVWGEVVPKNEEFFFFVSNKRKRLSIGAGSRFNLTLIGEEKYLNHYIASLWALIFLGGVGSKSRRGGGNLAIVKAPEGLPISFTPAEDLFNWYKENLQKAKAFVGGVLQPCEKYSNIQDTMNIKIGSTLHDSWHKALEEIEGLYIQYRRSIGVLNQEEKKEEKIKILKLANFGLPVFGKKVEAVLKEGKALKRRASPLIVKVVKHQEKYRWVLILLSGNILPDGAKFRFEDSLENPDLQILKGMLKNLGRRSR
ncbi:type III-B CRISPR module RAMP protein Cmr1 [Thermocrinis jamiesonii]|uniref:type III-B CRISPR module RAMP protein Cmr1 n=1 Tax=Thermocrinis jamiesonii TaxID=1302351 RepID=UPI000496915B|nr:type III-B CRISPR module RAMP protein Cmr1 [Thermocrinis jamiesonii]